MVELPNELWIDILRYASAAPDTFSPPLHFGTVWRNEKGFQKEPSYKRYNDSLVSVLVYC